MSLHAEGIITNKQFKVKSQSISEHSCISKSQNGIKISDRAKKNQEKNILAFKIIVDNFLELDEKNQQDMKQTLQRMIDKIKVSDESEIVIHHNLAL